MSELEFVWPDKDHLKYMKPIDHDREGYTTTVPKNYDAYLKYSKMGGVDLNGSTRSDADTGLAKGVGYSDIAQSRCATAILSGFPKFKTPGGSYSDFLPIKSVTFNFTSYENMSIPVAILGNFPLLQRKQVKSIQLTCYDIDDDRLERAILKWEQECFPKGKYVAYLEDIARTFVYKSFDVKGRQNYELSALVIPSGQIGVSRSYDINSEKLLTFTIVAIGEVGQSAQAPGQGPLVDIDLGQEEAYVADNLRRYDSGNPYYTTDRYDHGDYKGPYAIGVVDQKWWYPSFDGVTFERGHMRDFDYTDLDINSPSYPYQKGNE